MADIKKLHRITLKMAGLLKAQAEDYLDLSTEVSALKDTLQALSRERFLPLFEKYKADAEQRAARGRADVLRGYDQLIRQLAEDFSF
jgi:hypothetical protein